MKKILIALLFTLVSAAGASAQRGGRYAAPFAHISVGQPLATTSDNFNTGISGNLGVEIASATADSRIGWRAVVGFNHFGSKTANTSSSSNALNVTSGNGEIVLALHPATSPIGVFAVGGVGFYQHKIKVQTGGLSLDRTSSDVGLDGGLTIRLFEKHVMPELEARAHYVFSGDDKITYVTIGIGVLVNRRGQRR